LILTFSGCANKPTFPEATITDSIESITKDLYDLETTGRVAGETIGVMLYVDTMLDETKTTIPPEVHEKLGNLTQVVTRIALSTDAEVEFIVVAMRGEDELMELRLVRYVDDIKKAHTEALAITESMNRTLFQQARYDLTAAQTEPFPLDRMTMEEFLTQQILQRTRFAKAKTEEEEEAPETPGMPTELFDGRFAHTVGGGTFEFSVLTFQPAKSQENLLKILQNARDVLGGYKFEPFNWVIIRDLLTGQKITLDRHTLMSFWNKEISEEEILSTHVSQDIAQGQVFQNALEIFGLKTTESEAPTESEVELIGDEQ